MKTLYLDLFSGISGDMFLGAMLDLGVDLHALEHELEKIELDHYHLHASRQQRGSVAGTKLDVHLEDDCGDAGHSHPKHEHGHDHDHDHDPGHRESSHSHKHEHGRNFSAIKQLISHSELSEWVKTRSIAVFQRIASAEGKIHGKSADDVHFHEVGAVDSIVDIVGACIALELLGKPRVQASPVVEGSGWVKCAHGNFPVPAPATLEILGARGVSVTQCEEPHELVTPTGAALLAELAEGFGPMRDLTPQKIGYGLGTRENRTRPNVLRAVLGESSDAALHDWETDFVCVLQTNLDDTNAELLGAFVEKAMTLGALDVFHTPIQMKKSRPGVLLSVMCGEKDGDLFAALILRETTAFGVRRHTAERRKLRREFTTAPTAFGEVRVKLGKLDGQIVQAAPEFESCRLLAERAGVPVKQVYEAALRALKS